MENKAKEKDDFFLKKNYYSFFKFLTNEKKGVLIESIFRFECEGIKADFSNIPDLIPFYEFIINDLENNNQKYNIACEKNKSNISKRWNKKKEVKNED